MNMIERYVERMMAESTPERPLWNIEKIKEGKINGWNYIDGCMMIALLNLYRITGQSRYYAFAEHFLDHYVFEDGSLRGFKEEDYNLDNICEGRVLFDVYALSGNGAIAAPIISSVCIVSLLLSRIFLKEKLSWKTYAFIAVVIIGILLLAVSEEL